MPPAIPLNAPMNDIRIPVSIGELIDKITILEIKLEHLQSEALQNVERELGLLREVLTATDLTIAPELWNDLARINRSLWRIEDDIRELERRGRFDAEFIALARSVYQQNDRRAAIKKEINTTYCSSLMEEKAYQDY
jgi:hypothetical protein